MSLAAKIMVGMGLGILLGLFLGERAAFLGYLGEGFVQLLQMTVLPFVTVSLITGLGGLDYRTVGAIARTAGLTLLLLWGLASALVIAMPLAFPDWEAASFFTTALVAEREGFDFLQMYIPANPFNSLANSVVPAVVLFSGAVGVALIGVENKQVFLEGLAALGRALTRITNFVVSLTPFGVFGISASAAGIIRLDELVSLQVYVILFVGLALVAAFWILPALVATFTPLGYRDVVGTARDVLVTAFATGSVFVVLPVLAERSKELLERCGSDIGDARSIPDVVVPTAFSFPSFGTVLSLGFVLFAGWFTGASIAVTDYPVFVISGLMSAFGGVYIAIPFLLDTMRVPSDTMSLFVIVQQVIGGRFAVTAAAMHILTLTLLTACSVAGLTKVRLNRVVRYGAATLGMALLVLVGVRVVFTSFIGHEYQGYRIFVDMKLSGERVPTKLAEFEPSTEGGPLVGGTALGRIGERGSLRVGYFRDRLPFAFVNGDAELVGFDIELANVLALELGVSLEFVRLETGQMAPCLESGQCDVILSGLVATPERLREVAISKSYMDQTVAFVVKDHRRSEFNSRTAVRKHEVLTVAVPDIPYYIRGVQRYMPSAKIVPVDTPRTFFRQEGDEFDALVLSAEAGSSWSLVYPSYSVAVPHPDLVSLPTGCGVSIDDAQMLRFLDGWVELKKKDGTLGRIYDHWILGLDAEEKSARWSVIRDVLHWVD